MSLLLFIGYRVYFVLLMSENLHADSIATF